MRLSKLFRIGDGLLIALVLLSFALSIIIMKRSNATDLTVFIMLSNETVYRLPLRTAQHVVLLGPLGETVVELDGHTARITRAPCPQKWCMKMGRIRYSGQCLVCIPNRIIVQVNGKGRSRLDGVTQ
jgi:hypothetical protein